MLGKIALYIHTLQVFVFFLTNDTIFADNFGASSECFCEFNESNCSSVITSDTVFFNTKLASDSKEGILHCWKSDINAERMIILKCSQGQVFDQIKNTYNNFHFLDGDRFDDYDYHEDDKEKIFIFVCIVYNDIDNQQFHKSLQWLPNYTPKTAVKVILSSLSHPNPIRAVTINDVHVDEDIDLHNFRSVKEITITNTKMKEISRNFLISAKNKLLLINFAQNKIEILPSEIFTLQTKMLRLNLSHNEIRCIGYENRSQNFLAEFSLPCNHIDLSYNFIFRIFANFFNPLTQLTHLNLAYNEITSLDKVFINELNTILVLNLSHNKLDTIFETDFLFLHNLQELDLSTNFISHIDQLAFTNNKLLFEIFLDNNLLNFKENSALYFSSFLKSLHLPNNFLQKIPRLKLENLKLFDLRQNHISYLHLDDFDFMFKSLSDENHGMYYKQVLLQHNNIIIFDLQGYCNTQITNYHVELIFNLNDNPLKCDCSSVCLHANYHANGIYRQNTLIQFEMENLICDEPKNLAGHLFVEVDREFLQCVNVSSKCPVNCTCTFLSRIEIIVNCENSNFSSIPLNVPLNTTILIMSYNSLNSLQNLNRLSLLLEIQLKNCANLQIIFNTEISPFNTLRRLTALYLNNNNLISLPFFTLKGLNNLANLELSYNSFKILSKNLTLSLPNLRKISIDNNNISKVDYNCFENNLFLEHININNNEIELIELNLTHLNHLLSFNARNNRINSILIYWPKNIEDILLSNNNLQHLNLENFPSNLKNLDVSNNNLININIDVLEHFRHRVIFDFNYNNIKHFYRQMNYTKFLAPAREIVILINSNPIVCDCSNKNFLRLLKVNNNNSAMANVYFTADHLHCNAPEFLKDKLVLELKMSKLPCEHKDNCSENCKCYKQLSSEYRIIICDDFPIDDVKIEINELHLKNCSSKNISQLAKSNWNSLNVISMKNVLNLSLSTRIFSNMKNLTTITVSENINLKFNNLVFSNLTNLMKLDLSSNGIQNLQNNSFDGCFKLQYLNLSYNLISTLNENIFSHLIQLRSLDISNNKLSQLSYKIFQNLTFLKNFNVHNNLLTSLCENIFAHCNSLEKIDLSTNSLNNDILHYLVIPLQVIYLNLSKNIITKIEEQWLRLPKIVLLDLSFNLIQTIDFPQLIHFLNRAQIYLNDNRISTVELFDNFTENILNENFNKVVLTLKGNPFSCDCKLYNFIKTLKFFQKSLKNFPDQQLYCNQPTNLSNQLLVKVDDEDLFCELDNCPLYCICFYKAKDENNIVICRKSINLQICPKKVQVLYLDNLQNATDLKNNCWKLVNKLKISHSFLTVNISNDSLINQKNLLELNLSENNLTFIPTKLFQFNPLLEVIDISNNQLNYLPNDLFTYLKYLKKLVLNQNLFKSINWQIPINVEYLNLAQNNIKSFIIPNLNAHHKLKVLNLSKNWLQIVPNEPTFFSKVKNLEILDLSYNYISITCHNKTSFFPQSLLSLNLSNNLINCTHLWSFINKPTSKFKNLDISYNPIRILKLSDFIFTNNSKVIINLKNCTLFNYSFDLGERNYSKKLNAFLKIDVLKNDEIECDCDLTKFQHIKEIQKYNYSVKLLINTSKFCSVNKFTTNWALISNFYVLRNITVCIVKHSCPLFCLCLQSDTDVWMFCVDKKLFSLPLICPLNVKYLILDFNNISHLEGLNHSCWYSLSVISLRNNNISSLSNETFYNVTSLKKMYLDGNQLTKPLGWLEYFVENRFLPFHITLSNNPWLCDCNNLLFQNWVTNFSKFQMIDDAWNITCDNGYLMLNFDMCPVTETNVLKIVIPIVLTFSCILSVTLLTVFYYRNKTTVQAWMFSKNIFRYCVNEDEIDADKEYDAFLCYCEEDSEFVIENILPGLENNEPFYKVCIHHRDWLVGEHILDQIEKSVKNSRRTIIVLSKNFTQSFWANVEFKCANYHSVQDKINRVILVVLDEDFSTESLDSEFQTYIGMITYLKLGDSQFWNKLRYAMPHKKCRKKIQNLSLLQNIDAEDQL